MLMNSSRVAPVRQSTTVRHWLAGDWSIDPPSQARTTICVIRHGYSPSLNLTPKTGMQLAECEVDFAWIIAEPYLTFSGWQASELFT